jgi:hypothetical protein
MHGAFKAENPEIGSLPTPSDTITPGEFRRPFIAAGHERESAAASAPNIPTTTHPITAGQFTRGPLTEGHERVLTQKMAEFHDALSSWKPDLCRLAPMDANGRFDPERQPGYAFNRDGGSIAAQINNQQSASPQPRVMPPTKAAPGEKASLPHVASGLDLDAGTAVTQVTADQFAAALTKLAKLEKDNVALKAQYEQLAASPDPARSALRGVTGVVTKGTKITKLATTGSQKGSRKRAAKIETWRDMVSSTDANLRIYAQNRLRRAGVDI